MDGTDVLKGMPEECPLIRAVHFVSPSVGFAVAGGAGIILYGGAAPEVAGVVLATSDGGRSWHRLAAPADAQSVCFNDPRSGWLGRQPRPQSAAPLLARRHHQRRRPDLAGRLHHEVTPRRRAPQRPSTRHRSGESGRSLLPLR